MHFSTVSYLYSWESFIFIKGNVLQAMNIESDSVAV